MNLLGGNSNRDGIMETTGSRTKGNWEAEARLESKQE
jgi:hypothetical protein